MIVHIRSCWLLAVLMLSGRFLHDKPTASVFLFFFKLISLFVRFLELYSKSVEFPKYCDIGFDFLIYFVV